MATCGSGLDQEGPREPVGVGTVCALDLGGGTLQGIHAAVHLSRVHPQGQYVVLIIYAAYQVATELSSDKQGALLSPRVPVG